MQIGEITKQLGETQQSKRGIKYVKSDHWIRMPISLLTDLYYENLLLSICSLKALALNRAICISSWPRQGPEEEHRATCAYYLSQSPGYIFCELFVPCSLNILFVTLLIAFEI